MDRTHHQAMMDGLMAEMERLAPTSHRSASFMQKGWHLFDDEKKRKYLRMMVETVRESRTESRKFEERSAAAMLALGAEGIEAIYDVSPEEAMAKARSVLQEMSTAKQSLEMLCGMNLMTAIETTMQETGTTRPDQHQALVHFKKGHEGLEENLETVVAAGTTILLACISRAGGAELSDEERAQMRAQWDAAVNGASSK